MLQPILCSTLMLLSVRAALAQPVIDGEFTDWGTPLAIDAAGDTTSPLDLTALYAVGRAPKLFVRLDFAKSFNLASGPSANGTLTLRISKGASTPNITLDFRGRVAKVNSAIVPFDSIDFTSAPTMASSRHEMHMDLTPLGVSAGSTVYLELSGVDAFAAPIPVVLSGPPDPAPRRSLDRAPCAFLRIASLNTENDFTNNVTGLNDPSRIPKYTRLVRAANADVYLFQEEYSSTSAQIKSFLDAADPTGSGLPWNVVHTGDLAACSQFPLVAAQLEGSHLGAVVRCPGGPDVLVVTLHPKCCGYTGSSEDIQRIAQATTAVASLEKFRAGTLTPELAAFRNAPVIVAGDWNLVGSTTPLDRWTAGAPAGPGLTRLPLTHLIGTDTWTWASPNGLGFWPGALDLIAYQRPAVFAKRAFGLTTRELNAGELTALSLQAGDSAASDHLMLIADFSLFAAADLNSDQLVDDADFTYFAPAYDILDCASPAMQSGCPADLNFDGTVDDADFVLFVASYNSLLCL